MIDNIHTVKLHADILVLGDFNIDLLKPHSSWDSTITLLGLTQLVKSPTRITQKSATLIDHIYVPECICTLCLCCCMYFGYVGLSVFFRVCASVDLLRMLYVL